MSGCTPGDPAWARTGMVQLVDDWPAALDWVGQGAENDGLILFEKVGRGAVQDRLRADGYHVIGGSALGDCLEYDRGFGQTILRDVGLSIAPGFSFAQPHEAAA